MNPDESLINDEFHKIGRRIVRRSVDEAGRPTGGARPRGLYEPPREEVVVPARVSASLANTVTSGRLKLAQERCCRICHERYNLTRHHLVPISWFLGQSNQIRAIRNANANIIPLCESCHRIIDGVRDPVGRLQKRAAIRERLGTNEYAFILQVIGSSWLEENYPKDP